MPIVIRGGIASAIRVAIDIALAIDIAIDVDVDVVVTAAVAPVAVVMDRRPPHQTDAEADHRCTRVIGRRRIIVSGIRGVAGVDDRWVVLRDVDDFGL